jgi:hypothetical protein
LALTDKRGDGGGFTQRFIMRLADHSHLDDGPCINSSVRPLRCDRISYGKLN